MSYEVENSALLKWVHDTAAWCTPDDIHWCDGSDEEYDSLMAHMTESGMATPLQKRPHSYLFRSDPSDVARVEARTFISTPNKDDAGPTNNWIAPDQLKATLRHLFHGCMRGRTMYVIPYSMGPLDSPFSIIGVEISDSPYVVCNMRIMTRMGKDVIEHLGAEGTFYPALHSVGSEQDVSLASPMWPCADTDHKYIAHFPEERTIWSYGSGYGGNALLGKKSLSLRIASYVARQEGWMAEHMLILRLTNPQGRRFHIAAAFPSACGKTNLAMIEPTLPGWKAECLGDDIAWMMAGKDGRLWAINPEAGFFGVAPGTSYATNPAAMDTVRRNAIFTNCALTDDGDVWWEGINGSTPGHLIDWKGHDWTPENKDLAAHPNARFTAAMTECPVLSPDWEDPAGVPIDIFIFGGRRAGVVPLVTESIDWDHGVFMGATAASETTAAATGAVGNLRRDPFAMTPFCGYNMADYFQHWFDMGDVLGDKAPRIYYVNWFRKSSSGKWLWPGYGDNSRVLKWICERLEGKASAVATPIGNIPSVNDLDMDGLDWSHEAVEAILRVDAEAWKQEVLSIEQFFAQFGDRLPARLRDQLLKLAQRLNT